MMNTIHSDKMGSSPVGSDTTETGSVVHEAATTQSSSLLTTQLNAISARGPSNVESTVTPARGIVHSDPIDILASARYIGTAHPNTSPSDANYGQTFIPGRPPRTSPRDTITTAQELLGVPVSTRRVVSPAFHRLMSPGYYMRQHMNRASRRPGVLHSAAAAAPVVTPAVAPAQADDHQVFIIDDDSDFGSRDRSSILSDVSHVMQITSPTDGVPMTVPFPDNTPGPSRGYGTIPPRGRRNTTLLSSSVTSVMSPSSQISDDSPETIIVRRPGQVSCGPPRGPPPSISIMEADVSQTLPTY
ncbi:hypothetical protein F4781DRAFT_403155 [Annulohypoxylon bovei var. microspora]|nr:hypothetical protein F4781DRAFT_403155 [Annulohypoxylon bovei var. microspora]